VTLVASFPRGWEAAPSRAPERDVAPDAGRLERAMRQHLGLVWRLLRRLGLPPPDADEAAQDVFLVLARRGDDVPARAERAFLVGTALRVASDRRRQLASHAAVELTVEPASPHLLPDELLALRRARAALDEALDALTPEQRAVFVLVELEGWAAPEVARDLGLPLGTVASRLRKARELFDASVRRLHRRQQRRIR